MKERDNNLLEAYLRLRRNIVEKIEKDMEKLTSLVVLCCKTKKCYKQFVGLLLQRERSQVLLRASVFM